MHINEQGITRDDTLTAPIVYCRCLGWSILFHCWTVAINFFTFVIYIKTWWAPTSLWFIILLQYLTWRCTPNSQSAPGRPTCVNSCIHSYIHSIYSLQKLQLFCCNNSLKKQASFQRRLWCNGINLEKNHKFSKAGVKYLTGSLIND